jgi:hypothetical protein
VPTPRPAGAGLGAGPWLLPALQTYAVPEDERPAVARELMGRLSRLLADAAADQARFPGLRFFDTAAIPIDPAAPGSTGVSGDWVNEIHLTWQGYEKLALPWAAFIEQTLKP